MLANLVLPVFNENTFRSSRERRTTCGCHPSTVLTKKDEKRLQVSNEILETEIKYLTCLTTLKKIFEDRLREESIIPVKDIDLIFPTELCLIRDSHALFMKELQDRVQNWKQYGIVGDIFTKLSSSYHIDVLKIYSGYVNNFPKAMAVINKYSRGSQKFRRFLQNCSSEPECEGLDLAAYLLTPIQRLPRYVLLLRQLSKCTDASHPDSFHLENALETMKNMINILNDSIHNSCKIVSTSVSRKAVKRRSSRKRPSLKELKITKDDNDNKIIHVSSPNDNSPKSPDSSVFSSSPLDSPKSIPSSPKASPGNRSSPLTEHSFLTRFRSGEKKSRPVSTGDLDRFYETDPAKEVNAIVEEADAGKDDKTTGQSKLKSAAESVKRSWQRTSKKWRRSFEGKAISTNALPELDTENQPAIVFSRHLGDRFTFESHDSTLSPSISPINTPVSGSTEGLPTPTLENTSVASSLDPSPAISTSDIIDGTSKQNEVVTIKEQELLVLDACPTQGSPYARRGRGTNQRPCSVALPMKATPKKRIEDKSRSDNDLVSDNTPIWIHRNSIDNKHNRLEKRHSDSALRHYRSQRKSLSEFSADQTTATSTERLETSKDTLFESNESMGKCTENNNNFRHVSEHERHVLDDVIASGFKGNKTRSEDQMDDKLKGKKKFKDVVKYMFTKSKRKSNTTMDDSYQTLKPKILSRAKSFSRETTTR